MNMKSQIMSSGNGLGPNIQTEIQKNLKQIAKITKKKKHDPGRCRDARGRCPLGPPDGASGADFPKEFANFGIDFE